MGNKRIEAPEKIDRNTNRLPHGRNYAEKGAVLDVRIQRNFKIAARVQRTRPVPYKEKLKAILQNRSDLSAILLAGTLPKELFDIMESLNVKLFPERISVEQSERSERFLDLPRSILGNDEKMIVFTQYREMGDILKQLGLNLIAANYVGQHYGLLWNQSVEDQATDKALSIGQARDMIVHRFITLETFGEKINEMLEKKKELSENIVIAG